jgi:S-adenosylmethionine decarboxylase
MSFGKSAHFDCYGVDKYDCDDMEMAYRFVEELVDRIDMTLFGNISVFHGPRKNGIELYEDKAGLTCFAPLIESSITLHTIIPKLFLTLDVYSCKPFEPLDIKDFIEYTYQPTLIEINTLERGISY